MTELILECDFDLEQEHLCDESHDVGSDNTSKNHFDLGLGS